MAILRHGNTDGTAPLAALTQPQSEGSLVWDDTKTLILNMISKWSQEDYPIACAYEVQNEHGAVVGIVRGITFEIITDLIDDTKPGDLYVRYKTGDKRAECRLNIDWAADAFRSRAAHVKVRPSKELDDFSHIIAVEDT